MKSEATRCYKKPELTKLKIVPEESLFTGPKNSASSWSGESCFKNCRDRTLNASKTRN